MAKMATTEIAILRQENISAIVQSAPQSYNDNRQSHDRCLAAGQAILGEIKEGGMTDELDIKAAAYIDKARRTVKAMNERRSAVTKLFDEVRAQFTALENGIDPTKKDTVPAQLQAFRNAFAAQRRQEELRRQEEEARRRRAEELRTAYTSALTEALRRTYRVLLASVEDKLRGIYDGMTPANYGDAYDSIKSFPAELPESFFATMQRPPHSPELADEEAQRIFGEVLKETLPQFRQSFPADVDVCRNRLLDKMPSRKAKLERIAAASAAEAERMRADAAAREKDEAQRLERERLAKEAEERRQAELRRQAAEAQSLFDTQRAVSAYAPKTKATKKITLLAPDGILPVISMWWSKEGCTLTTDELAKIFKKQVAFCEKIANKDGELIHDRNVQYSEEIKAK